MKSTLGIVYLVLALATIACAEENKGWSWGGGSSSSDVNGSPKDPIEPTAEDYEAAETSFEPVNATSVDNVVDTILVSNRQGRNVEGLDEIYQDPNVKQALDSGDDTQARNVIKDRLCRLGLMQVL